ncbi:MAG: ABC transporter ATP-binding protein [Pyrinomonadaceae bacterium]
MIVSFDSIESVEPASATKKQAREGRALVVTELRKSFAAETENAIVEVLRGVSFAMAAGETLAIMGASGTGKSTLLHLLGGLEEADEGSARFYDFEITRAHQKELEGFREREIGFVFQFHHLLQDLTALENVTLPLRISRLSKAESLQRALAALDEVGLSKRAAHLVQRLSGGEQQRVALARAVVKNPSLILADEPTGNLDSRAGEHIGQLLLASARTRRACVLIATHNRELAALCDRTLHLQNGKILEV